MNGCLITYGYEKGCRDNIGGIKQLWLANLSAIASVSPALGSLTTPTDEGIIDAITMDGSVYFWEIQLTKDNGNFDVTTTVNAETGNVSFIPTLNFILPKMDVNTRNMFNAITRDSLVAIVLDNIGNYWILGEEFGLEATTATASSGKAKTELNGWTVALVGEEAEAIRNVDDAVIATVITP